MQFNPVEFDKELGENLFRPVLGQIDHCQNFLDLFLLLFDLRELILRPRIFDLVDNCWAEESILRFSGWVHFHRSRLRS